MVWVENQLVGAYEGQSLTLECRSEAHPSPITYWTKPTNETIANGEQTFLYFYNFLYYHRKCFVNFVNNKQ